MSTKLKATDHLSSADLAVLERLVEARVLIAKPQNGSAKPRRVIAAALAHGGKQIILWLSKNTMDLHSSRS